MRTTRDIGTILQRNSGSKTLVTVLMLVLTALVAAGLVTGCAQNSRAKNSWRDKTHSMFNTAAADPEDAQDYDLPTDNGDDSAPQPAAPSDLPADSGSSGSSSAKAKRTANYFKQFKGITIGGAQNKVDSYTITTNTDDVIKPAVKYRLTPTNTLEIHLYVAFATRSSVKAKPKDISRNSTLAKQYRSGVSSYWGISVNNSSYQYKTKVYWHFGNAAALIKAENDTSAQQYIEVNIGGVCPAYAPNPCPESVSGNHWYHAHPMGPVGYPGYASNIYLPTVAQTKANRTPQKRTHLTGKKFSAACAHETGHILGLADAYPAPDAKRVVDRMDENTQTAKKSHGQYCNLMKDQNSVKQVLPNDLKMVLTAYSSQVKNYGGDFLQNFKTYTWYDSASSSTKYKLSPAITNSKDNVHN